MSILCMTDNCSVVWSRRPSVEQGLSNGLEPVLGLDEYRWPRAIATKVTTIGHSLDENRGGGSVEYPSFRDVVGLRQPFGVRSFLLCTYLLPHLGSLPQSSPVQQQGPLLPAIPRRRRAFGHERPIAGTPSWTQDTFDMTSSSTGLSTPTRDDAATAVCSPPPPAHSTDILFPKDVAVEAFASADCLPILIRSFVLDGTTFVVGLTF